MSVCGVVEAVYVLLTQAEFRQRIHIKNNVKIVEILFMRFFTCSIKNKAAFLINFNNQINFYAESSKASVG